MRVSNKIFAQNQSSGMRGKDQNLTISTTCNRMFHQIISRQNTVKTKAEIGVILNGSCKRL